MGISFKKVPAKEVEALKSSGPSNRSKPILEDFLASTQPGDVVEVNVDGEGIKADSLYQVLNQYALNHEVPAQGFMRGGKVFLEHLTAARLKPAPKAASNGAGTETAAVDSGVTVG